MEMTLEQKVVDMVGWSSAALEKAAANEAAREKTAAAITQLIPQAVQALLVHGRIFPGQQKEAAELLSDPVKAMELIVKIAAHRNTDELSPGKPADVEKAAGANGFNSLTNPNVGARSNGGHTKQSDYNLFKALGLNPPTNG